MAKHFKTHAIALFSRINIQEENVLCYCSNYNCSKQMTSRLLEFKRFIDNLDNKESHTIQSAIDLYLLGTIQMKSVRK